MKYILILEDESLIRQSITHTVRKEGYVVTTTGDIKEARHIAGNGRYDLVIIDLSLQNITDGLQFIEEMKCLSNNTKIMALTTHIEDEMKKDKLSDIIDAVCEKPFELSDIRNTVNNLLMQNTVVVNSPLQDAAVVNRSS